MQCSILLTHGISEESMKEAVKTKSASITVNGKLIHSFITYHFPDLWSAPRKEKSAHTQGTTRDRIAASAPRLASCTTVA